MKSQRSQFSGSNNEWNCGSRVFNFIEKNNYIKGPIACENIQKNNLKESLNSDSQQFHQYQQNELSPLNSHN
jgi:hypothetical protein